ncbi:MAG: gene transfer agent family protein [Pseudomonadota bacterium]
MSVNGARGEVALMVDGKGHKLCLTLGALAEIETAFGCESLSDLDIRMRNLSAADLVVVLRALLRGGGATDLAQSVADTNIQPSAAAKAVAEAFQIGLLG